MAEPREIEEILADLADSYPDWKPQNVSAVFRQYVDSLKQFPASLIKQAANRCRDTCNFFPKIAEIRKAIESIRATTVPDTSLPYMEKQPLSPETKKYLQEFRDKMVAQGKMKAGRNLGTRN